MKLFPLFYPATTAATSFTTPPINVGDWGNISAAVFITGADVVGTLSVQGAIEKTFARPILMQAATAVTASADTLISLSYVGLPYIRFVWAYTSGTGNISIDVSIREPKIWAGA